MQRGGLSILKHAGTDAVTALLAVEAVPAFVHAN